MAQNDVPAAASFSVQELDRHFRNMPDAFFLMQVLLDENGAPCDWLYVYANEAALENAGIPRDDFIGHTFFSLFGDTGDRKWLEPYYQAAYLGQSQVLNEYSPEVHRFVQVTCFPYDYGYAGCFVRDVTQSRMYERSIESATGANREIYFVDLTTDYYHMVYPKTGQKAEQGSYAQAIDQHIRQRRILPDDEAAVRAFLAAENVQFALRDKDYIEQKYRRTAPNGEPEWCLVSFSVSDRQNGLPVTAVMGIRSVDALVRAELAQKEQLQQAVAAAERANRAKSDFLSSMSHDMRTPLNIVIGMATLARLHQDDPAQVQDCMEKIETSGKHLLTLINQVLDMAKIESGEMTLSEGAFTIPSLMNQLTQMAHGMIAGRHQVLNFNVRDVQHENVIGDENRLVQVLLNLLSNAAKYSEPGQRIVVELAEKPAGQPGMACYRFAVADHGRGMSPAFMQRLFQPFAREEDPRLSKVQGTGLGMAVTQRIVQQMGGEISVTSRQGQGSCFVVELPLKLQPAQPQPAVFPAERVLVVDDYQDCIASICAVLEAMDAPHVWAQNGQAALALLAQAQAQGKPFTCALLDYRMPDMDGLALAQRIKAEYGDSIRVGIVSAYDYSHIQRQGADAGVDFFCPKPVFRSVLTQIFRGLQSGEVHRPTLRQPAPARPLRALVAEDNTINATIAARLLEHFGLRVELAENGAQAVEMLMASPKGWYDCVFMDIQMPVMNGLEATRAIRASSHPDAGLPIFAMTANAFTDDREQTRAAGMQEHVSKPIALDQLRAVLCKWFPAQMAAAPEV